MTSPEFSSRLCSFFWADTGVASTNARLMQSSTFFIHPRRQTFSGNPSLVLTVRFRAAWRYCQNLHCRAIFL